MSDVSSYYVGIEFVSGSFTNVTDDVTTFSVTRQMGDMFNGMSASELQLQLINNDATYGRTINLRPNIPIQIKATHQASERNIFTGKVDDWFSDPSLLGPRHVTLSARDAMKELSRETISTSLFANTNIGSLFAAVLGETSVQSFTIEPFGNALPYYWERQTLATDAMNNLMGTDHAYVFICPTDCVKVLGHYFANLASTVSSIDDASSGTNVVQMTWTTNDDGIFNNVFVETIPREPSTTTTSVAAIPDIITWPASSHISFRLDYIDPINKETAPAIDIITPVNSQDWFVATDETEATPLFDTTSLVTEISGATIVASLFNGTGQDAVLTKFVVRGKPITRLSPLRVNAVNSASQAEFGQLDLTHANEFIGNRFRAQPFAEYLRNLHANPLPDMQMTTRNRFPFILDRNLGDIVHVVNSFLGVASNFWIQAIEHTISTDIGWVHDSSYLLKMVKDEDLLILNDAVQGELDSTHELGF